VFGLLWFFAVLLGVSDGGGGVAAAARIWFDRPRNVVHDSPLAVSRPPHWCTHHPQQVGPVLEEATPRQRLSLWHSLVDGCKAAVEETPEDTKVRSCDVGWNPLW